MTRNTALDLSVYLVLDETLCGGLDGMMNTASKAAKAGIGTVQLRLKTASTAERISAGNGVIKALAGTGAAFVMNDDVEAAIAVQAHGLHIGQDDMSSAQARSLIGPEMILGLSTETPFKSAQVDPSIVDYIGAGPVFATPTKGDHKAPVGFEGLAKIIDASPVPAVAIGGLKAPHIGAALQAGAAGIAVVSAICGQPDPSVAAQTLLSALKEARS